MAERRPGRRRACVLSESSIEESESSFKFETRPGRRPRPRRGAIRVDMATSAFAAPTVAARATATRRRTQA